MAQYRKKPVVIEAVQFNGPMPFEKCPTWFFEALMLPVGAQGRIWQSGETLVISTLEGDLAAQSNDWIIRGGKGEIYPCKPDLFEATYEPV